MLKNARPGECRGTRRDANGRSQAAAPAGTARLNNEAAPDEDEIRRTLTVVTDELHLIGHRTGLLVGDGM